MKTKDIDKLSKEKAEEMYYKAKLRRIHKNRTLKKYN